MSSTSRGGNRIALDHYRTPAWCVEAIIPHLPHKPTAVLDPGCGDGAIGKVVGPAFNVLTTGIEIDEAHAATATASNAYTLVTCGDYLTVDWDRLTEHSLIIGNPPYSLAMEFVLRSLELVGDTGTVCLLLRLAWLASNKRRDFHRKHPADVYVLPKRPSFCWSHTYIVRCSLCGKEQKIVERVKVGERATTNMKLRIRKCKHCSTECPMAQLKATTTTTDSCDYAWFVWHPGPGGHWQIL